MISVERLKDLLHYDPDTGLFTCRVYRGSNSKIGSIAGTLLGNGYTHIKIDQRAYKAHRLAWLYMHGQWPSKHIDHINGKKSDNRLANLRDVSRSENLHNVSSARKSNKSSRLLGAHFHKRVGRWSSHICIDRKTKHLGYFDTEVAAHKAYLLAKKDGFGLV